ncbi:hypothetical protein K491DRAFT_687160 [Lophiostoma macrostomum CBS 122681]|uniref:F-box domain-containing protein n=1 Tax=Lophiostoma macrostomum CBS 122681 TaxID=1314788 RepID=A0A6A6TR11_9PLEO|nr:hypothetical protein K491DRAFT_687160 [Lophiostoma macrostomum CBS 122681]
MLGSRNRSSSIPRDYQKRRCPDFSLLDAGELLDTLKALDRALDTTPVAQHKDIDYNAIVRPRNRQTKAEDEALRIQLFNHIKGRVPQPLGIPIAFVEAYKSALVGQCFVNETKADNLFDGRACMCSESLRCLSGIENMAGTHLQKRFDVAYAKGTSHGSKKHRKLIGRIVKLFPFLRLPAEIRLQIYGYHLQRHRRLCYTLEGIYQGVSLPILRVCCQINNEVIKYLFENRTLNLEAHAPRGDIGRRFLHEQKQMLLTYIPPSVHVCITRLDLSIEGNDIGLTGAFREKMRTKPDHAYDNADNIILDTLALLPNLETVQVQLNYPWQKGHLARERILNFIQGISHSTKVDWEISGWDD